MSKKIEKVKIKYGGTQVNARKVTVSSIIPIDIESAWLNVQKSALLHFVCKGKVLFKPENGEFPKVWKELEKVSTKMLLFGFLPFGGTHTIYFEKIDHQNFILQTQEFDNAAKVWGHKISLLKKDEYKILYTDEVYIYGGLLTNLISYWALSFYKHRQSRWQIIAKNNIHF